MTLDGSLEDLNIRDLLQILSLSKKSGTLTLVSPAGKGQVCFQNGQVIRAHSTAYPDCLGQLLKKNRLVSQDQIDKALAYQQALAEHQPLGRIFANRLQIPPGTIEQLVASHIEEIVFSFFSWRSGTFTFKIHSHENFGSAQLNPLDFMLEKGLNSERLALKGWRLNKTGAIDDCDERSLDIALARLHRRQNNKGINLLRGMLAELDDPDRGGGIILLILRYASEIMSRAIVFDVRGQTLIGLGQFGLNEQYANADEVIRRLRLPIDRDSLFARVLKEQRTLVEPLGETPGESSLKELLGATAERLFVGPLLNDGKVVALLVGDNYPAQEPLSAVNSFQVFLSRAGLALEQAISR